MNRAKKYGAHKQTDFGPSNSVSTLFYLTKIIGIDNPKSFSHLSVKHPSHPSREARKRQVQKGAVSVTPQIACDQVISLAPPPTTRPAPSHPAYEAGVLMAGGLQAQIVLNDQIYTLRITRAGKLILTK